MRARRILFGAALVAVLAACATTGMGQTLTTTFANVRAATLQVWSSGTRPSAQTDTTQQATFGAWDGAAEASVVVAGATRSYLALGSNYTVSPIAGAGQLYFTYGPRSQTNLATGGIARIYSTTTTADSTSGGSLTFETRPTSGSMTSRLTIGADGTLTTASGLFAPGVPVHAPNGSVSAPSFAFTSTPSSGMHYDASNGIVFSTAGALNMSMSGAGFVRVWNQANGLGGIGPRVLVGRNSTSAGAAGTLGLVARNDAVYNLWVQAGLLRIHTAPPNEDDSISHTAGTVVGDQTSFRASKDLLGQPTDASLLDAVLRTPIHHFRYKDGRYNGETFTGIVTDESPWFGKDDNRALNEINGLGYLVGAVRELERRLAASEARVAALEAAR